MSSLTAIDIKTFPVRYMEEAFNQRKFEVLDEIFSAELMQRIGPSVVPFLTAFPDWHGTVDDIIAEGDTVVNRWTGHGTHLVELRQSVKICEICGKNLRSSALRQSVKICEICGKNLQFSALRQSVKISEICGKNLRPWHADLLSRISCPEEIAYRMGFIDRDTLRLLGTTMRNNQYGAFLLQL